MYTCKKCGKTYTYGIENGVCPNCGNIMKEKGRKQKYVAEYEVALNGVGQRASGNCTTCNSDRFTYVVTGMNYKKLFSAIGLGGIMLAYSTLYFTMISRLTTEQVENLNRVLKFIYDTPVNIVLILLLLGLLLVLVIGPTVASKDSGKLYKVCCDCGSKILLNGDIFLRLMRKH